MRKLTVNILGIAAAALVCVADADVARAEVPRIVATVPFDFVVGGAPLPAGKYFVKPASEGATVIEIESADGRHTAYTLTTSASSNVPVPSAELVFEKRDNRYFLERLVTADGDEREITRTHGRNEHEVAIRVMP
jgi:hypothetical protein